MTACHDDGSTLVGHRGLAQIALIGSPNAGKTTLFNALTGLRSKTANYPGITVTRREATVEVDGGLVRLVDLPGTYSLDPISPDEAVVADALHGRIEGIDPPDAIGAGTHSGCGKHGGRRLDSGDRAATRGEGDGQFARAATDVHDDERALDADLQPSGEVEVEAEVIAAFVEGERQRHEARVVELLEGHGWGLTR